MALDGQRIPGPWTALVMNCNTRRSHPSVERRRRRLLVVVRTERLLFHGVEAIRERLEELTVLWGNAVGKFRDLHLALQQLLDGGSVFVVAVDVVVSWLAIGFDRDLLIVAPAHGAERSPAFAPTDPSPASQATHLQRLTAINRYPAPPFTNTGNLVALRAALVLDKETEQSGG